MEFVSQKIIITRWIDFLLYQMKYKENNMCGGKYCLRASLVILMTVVCNAQTESVTAPGAEVEKLAGGLGFTEGPAVDANGNIYFTDIPNNRIHKWPVDPNEPGLSTFLENSEGANGLYFDVFGDLLACEGGGRQLVSIDPNGEITILADKYNDKHFNSLNDLWIDPEYGVYFTDPRYGSREGMEQDGEHVYYLAPDYKRLIRVIDDMVRPNGLIGTRDGDKLYVSDHGDNKTFVYTINKDGTLSDKKLFAPEGSDGMTIDERGNIYLTTDVVAVYNKDGQKIQSIKVPETPSNVTFGGRDRQTLFITARTSLYSIRMQVKGIKPKVKSKFHYEPVAIGNFPITLPTPSLIGRPVPDLKGVGVELPPDSVDKMLLVCLLDINQRPSRNCLRRLNERQQQLRESDVVVVALDISDVNKKQLGKWQKENQISFPVSKTSAEAGRRSFDWGAKSLPWLVLANREHIVTAEGFSLSELDEKIPQADVEPRFERDIIATDAADLEISFVGHGTLMFDYNGKIIHVDPVGRETDYDNMPKADLVLVTHSHGDHLDPGAIEKIRTQRTIVILPESCHERVPYGIVMNNGDERTIKTLGLKIEAIPAYNIVHVRSGNNPYHPKGEGNGYVITFGDKRVYVAGDTENTPEMKSLEDIDVAFLPMNVPYTMTPEMVADAAKAFRPKILYPYHYSRTDPQELVELLKDEKDIEVRIRDMR